jgi:hypothetical protein
MAIVSDESPALSVTGTTPDGDGRRKLIVGSALAVAAYLAPGLFYLFTTGELSLRAFGRSAILAVLAIAALRGSVGSRWVMVVLVALWLSEQGYWALRGNGVGLFAAPLFAIALVLLMSKSVTRFVKAVKTPLVRLNQH